MSERNDSAIDDVTIYLSRNIWLTYGALLLIAVPWYWRFMPGIAASVCCGMPFWVTVSIAASMMVSLYTGWLLMAHPWPSENEKSSDHGEAGIVQEGEPRT